MKGTYDIIKEMHMWTREILAFPQTTQHDLSAFSLRLSEIPNQETKGN